MLLDSQTRFLSLIFSVLLVTLGLTGLWQDQDRMVGDGAAVADTMIPMDLWEISGGPIGESSEDSDRFDPEVDQPERTSVTGPVSMPFDERAQERSHILRELENRSATLSRQLRTEWSQSRKDFENRMQSLLDQKSSPAIKSASQFFSPDAGVRPQSANHQKVKQMIYPIVQMKGNGTVGSGVAVANQPAPRGGWYVWVVSAFHVVEEVRDFRELDTKIVDVHFFDPHLGRVSEDICTGIEMVGYPESDLSLLRIERDSPWPHLADVATEEVCDQLSVFDSVYAVGCPLGNQPIPTRGEISSQYKPVGDEVYWMVSAPTFFGNSGGGIFLSENCQLVGISSMIYTYGKRAPMVVPHMGLFVPLSQVRSWLRREGFAHLLGSSEGIPVSATGDDQGDSRGEFGSF
ncbi:MAG: hypothetical protein CBC13_02740 [Planctomycetia bacterium TMED53]|nr:MAG: hypothetical protein CBC13_02740 [Planctomycetia bacterium TMED53]